ncbi:MAG: hypothetical protein ABI606_09580 [Rhodoferax sp.]
MFSFFNFGRFKSGDRKGPSTLLPVAVSENSQQHTATRRELIRTVLRETLKKHGIPSTWIGCETVMVMHRAGNVEYLTYLVVTKWNDHLMRFAPALQQQLCVGLCRFDSAANPSKYTFYWKFSTDCGCPVTVMPEPSFWAVKPIFAKDETSRQPGATTSYPVGAVPSVHRKKFDLPYSEYDHRSAAFAPTLPSDLI